MQHTISIWHGDDSRKGRAALRAHEGDVESMVSSRAAVLAAEAAADAVWRAEMERELAADDSFKALCDARRDEAIAHQEGDDGRPVYPCDACGHDCYAAELAEGACRSCRQLAGLAESLYGATRAA